MGISLGVNMDLEKQKETSNMRVCKIAKDILITQWLQCGIRNEPFWI